ncbi:hypothetical protein KOEU_38640 [Komagataeibacter europaeus]|uniref:Uncharacterized protein n=1 Tax=Komagataeibacter europaeus TaxID=33995 RepID=A0A0M0EBI8_KOMEU|nr:hypothetical protein KOEU_38640 [Komagataeibacter europaeus]
MTLIRGILKGPYSNPLSDVAITMRAQKTTHSVLTLSSSVSVTDIDGKYSLTVEPGEYDVLLSTHGTSAVSIGSIKVNIDSLPGTLNDFLLKPNESDITPEVIQIVDRMRVDAAVSAAAAKLSEQNAADSVKPVVDAGFGSGPIHKDDAFAKDNKSSIQRYTVATKNRPGNVSGAVMSLPIDGGPSCAYFSIAVGRQSWVGSSATTSPGVITWSRLFSDIDKPTVEDIPNLKDWGLTKAVTAANRGDFNSQMKSRRGFVATDPLGNPFKDTGTYFLDTRSWAITQDETNDSYRTVQTCFGYGVNGSQLGKIALRGWNGTTFSNWTWMWSEANTTVDVNGFIKKASPIVKVFGDGTCELNTESQGVTTKRISVGVYLISGTLGFNADAGWGGATGGIEIPLDINKRAQIWVDFKVLANGDIELHTYHREHQDGPIFARNVIERVSDGDPIDIPDGRWVDLRVEMPEVELVIDPAEANADEYNELDNQQEPEGTYPQ